MERHAQETEALLEYGRRHLAAQAGKNRSILFKRCQVEYIVIGGTAAVLMGLPAPMFDVDVCSRAETKNWCHGFSPEGDSSPEPRAL